MPGPPQTPATTPFELDESLIDESGTALLDASEVEFAKPASALDVAMDTPVSPLTGGLTSRNLLDTLTGAGKGALSTITHTGNLVRKIPGIKQLDAAIGSVALPKESIVPSNTAQRIGFAGEQMAEAAIPATKAGNAVALATKGARPIIRLGAQMAAGGATNAATGVTQGHQNIGRDAAIGAAAPIVGGALAGTARAVGKVARPFVQSALKTPVAILKDQAGAARDGIEHMSEKIADTVLKHRLFTADKATGVVNGAMGKVDDIVAANAAVPVAAPPRVDAELAKLAAGAQKLTTPQGVLTKVAGKRAQVLEGPMGEDVTTTVMQPKLISASGPNGKPVIRMVPVTQTTRQLRPTVPAKELREATLERSKWNQGEYDDGVIESAVDSAEREALKDALPETVPHFETAAGVINARRALRLAHVRDANRDTLGLAGTAGAVVGSAHGNPAAIAAGGMVQAYKNGQLHLGIWANDFAQAAKRNDVVTMGRILQKLGVAVTDQAIPREGAMTVTSGGPP